MHQAIEEKASSRRALLVSAIYGLWGLIAAALGAPAAVYLLFPPRTKKAEEWIEAGRADNLRLKVPEELVFRRNRTDGWKVTSEKTSAWVVKMAPGHIVAFAPQCTHLGCAYHWDEQKQQFLCPCHTSTFSLDGSVTSGPAPRALDRFESRIADGKILIGAVSRSGRA